jgi:hypothetical protein
MQGVGAPFERPAKGHSRIKLNKLRFQLLVDEEQRSQRTVDVAVTTSHDPLDGNFAGSRTHLLVRQSSLEYILGIDA